MAKQRDLGFRVFRENEHMAAKEHKERREEREELPLYIVVPEKVRLRDEADVVLGWSEKGVGGLRDV